MVADAQIIDLSVEDLEDLDLEPINVDADLTRLNLNLSTKVLSANQISIEYNCGQQKSTVIYNFVTDQE